MIDIKNLTEGLIETNPGLWASPSVAGRDYPDELNEWCARLEENSFWFEHRNRCIIEAVSQFPPAGPIFDIGGGNGYVSLGLKKAGFEAILVEPGAEGIKCAISRGLAPVVHATVEDAKFKESSVPAFGGFDLLEHVKNDTDYLAFLRRLLINNGRLYLTVPAYNWLWSLEDDISEHSRRYTLSGIAGKLKSVGFSINYASYFFWILPLPIFLLRTLPSILRRKKKLELTRLESEHQKSGGWTSKMVDRLLDFEFRRIQKKKPTPFGSSCLIVATRTK